MVDTTLWGVIMVVESVAGGVSRPGRVSTTGVCPAIEVRRRADDPLMACAGHKEGRRLAPSEHLSFASHMVGG